MALQAIIYWILNRLSAHSSDCTGKSQSLMSEVETWFLLRNDTEMKQSTCIAYILIVCPDISMKAILYHPSLFSVYIRFPINIITLLHMDAQEGFYITSEKGVKLIQPKVAKVMVASLQPIFCYSHWLPYEKAPVWQRTFSNDLEALCLFHTCGKAFHVQPMEHSFPY